MYKNEYKMILLAGSGSCEHEEKIIEGKLVQQEKDIVFQCKDFTIIFNYNVENVLYTKLSEIAKKLQKYIYLYVDKESYRQFMK